MWLPKREVIVYLFLCLSWPACHRCVLSLWQPVSVIAPNRLQLKCTFNANVSTPITISLQRNAVVLAHADIYPNGTLNHVHQEELFEVIGSMDFLTFSKVSNLTDAGLYSCNGLQNGLSAVHEVYNVSVKGSPTTALDKNSPLEVYVQDNVDVRCATVGNPQPTVFWMKSTDSNSVSKGSVLSFGSIAFNNAGTYQCVARNSYGNSSASLQIVVKASVPGVPQGVSVTDIRQDRVTLLWSHSLPGKSPILSYRVTVDSNVEPDQPGTAVSYTVPSLASDTTFVLKLQACNAYGCGDAAVINTTTLKEGAPAEPTNLKFINATSDSVTLSWTHGTNRTKIVLYSQVLYHPPEWPGDSSVLVNGERNVYTVYMLEAYKEYIFTVKTCISNSLLSLCSQPSAPLSARTAMAAPSEPLEVTIFNTKDAEVAVSISWLPPASLNGPPNVNYRVFYRANGSTMWTAEDVINPDSGNENSRRKRRSSELNHVLKMLQPRTLYLIKVGVFSAAGLTNSSTVSIQTDEAAPNKPVNLTLVKREAHSLTIDWSAPVLDTSVVNIYNIDARDLVNGKSLLFQSEQADETTIGRLLADTAYNVSVFITLNRKRDKTTLRGEAATATYTTDVMTTPPPPEDETSQAALIAATIISLLALTIAMVIAVWYCRKKNLLGVTYRSTFYVEDDSVPLSLRRSIRQSAKRHAVAAEKFHEHVARLHRDSDYLFSEEYGSLAAARGDLTWVHSTSNLNQPKNRYPDIVAYDHSRVRLMSIDGIPSSNYINANFVDGYKRTDAYIATQAPLSRTVDDYWRMIWEQDCRIIIMVTNLWERGRRKCDQYWPNEGQQVYVDVTVEKTFEKTYASYVLRTFYVTKNKTEEQPDEDEKPRVIYQYHFTDWPDFGVPQDKATVLSFIAKTRVHEADHKAPSLVHCSAGVGRSGTFIALDVQMRRVDKERTVDIYNFVKHMRSQRNFMVQQEGQFVFIYDALLEYIQFGSTEIKLDELEKTIDSKYNDINPKSGLNQISTEWLNISNMKIPEHTMNIGKRPCNFRKNRDPCIIPVDSGRARLTMRAAAEGTDYINASYIDSYLEKRALIVTQAPLPDTVEDFWRLIWENVTMVVVSLLSDEELQEADFCDYMPRKGCNPINFGAFEIECLKETGYSDFTMRSIRLKYRIECGESEHRDIWHFHFHDWTEDRGPSSVGVFEMIRLVKQKQIETDMKKTKYESHPLVFHCSCGVGRSGVFCALYNMWEQLDDETGSVNIATTVKVLRNQRPFMIQAEEDYNFLYGAVVDMQTFMTEQQETENSNC